MRIALSGVALLAVSLFGSTAAAPIGFRQQSNATAQGSDEAQQRVRIEKANGAEHKRELDLLHLTATRPGVSGDGKGDPPVNYDERRAGVTDASVLQPGTLPAVLRFADGKPVRNAKDWQRRRAELFRLFDQVELGVTPARTPVVRWNVVSASVEGRQVPGADGRLKTMQVVVRKVSGELDRPDPLQAPVKIQLTYVLPSSGATGAIVHPVPVVMEFHWNFPKEILARLPKEPGPTWQQQVLSRGWGYAEYEPFSVQPDNAAGLVAGVIGATNKGRPRSVDDWGALKAWAWGASRSLDYLATDPHVDARRVAIEGHSRFGKAALVAMAYDSRFAAAFVSSSGAGGANLWRRGVGEQLENVEAAGEFHWEGGNLLKYAADPLHVLNLPLDQHELIALCAPRPVFLSGGAEGDRWADPHGMFLAAVAASPVWDLLEAHGLRNATGPMTAFPKIETPVVAGDLAFRQHTAGHTPGPNWPAFLDFAARHFAAP